MATGVLRPGSCNLLINCQFYLYEKKFIFTSPPYIDSRSKCKYVFSQKYKGFPNQPGRRKKVLTQTDPFDAVLKEDVHGYLLMDYITTNISSTWLYAYSIDTTLLAFSPRSSSHLFAPGMLGNIAINVNINNSNLGFPNVMVSQKVKK